MRIVFLLFLILIQSCGDSFDFRGSSDSLILKGRPSSEESVVALTTDILGKDIQFCSGVAIKKTIVLTAAHCINHFLLYPTNQKVRVYFGMGKKGGHFRGQYKIESAVSHPNFSIDPNNQKDLAILFLKESLPLKKENLPSLPSSEEENEILTEIKAPVRIFGFGFDHHGIRGIRNEAKTIIIDNKEDDHLIGGVGGIDSCEADSGGPVFSDATNTLTHLLSRPLLPQTKRSFLFGGDQTLCGSGGFYTEIYPLIPWIQQELLLHENHLLSFQATLPSDTILTN